MNDIYKWQKSSYSVGQGNCVEVAGNVPGTVAVRDSKDPAGPYLAFPAAAWQLFVSKVKEQQI